VRINFDAPRLQGAGACKIDMDQPSSLNSNLELPDADRGGLDVASIMILCPGTLRPLYTGIDTDPDTFNGLQDISAWSTCPACGIDHHWNKRIAWLTETPPSRTEAWENIKHIRSRLWSEISPDARSELHRLLIMEMDKLGDNVELVTGIEETLMNLAALIETQRKLVGVLENNGLEGVERARALLDGLESSHVVLHKEYHQKMIPCFKRTHPWSP
jgi:hypothetical protein